MEIKIILEINGKSVVILPDKPYQSAVCDVDGQEPLTRDEKIQVTKWIDKYFKKK